MFYRAYVLYGSFVHPGLLFVSFLLVTLCHIVAMCLLLYIIPICIWKFLRHYYVLYGLFTCRFLFVVCVTAFGLLCVVSPDHVSYLLCPLWLFVFCYVPIVSCMSHNVLSSGSICWVAAWPVGCFLPAKACCWSRFRMSDRPACFVCMCVESPMLSWMCYHSCDVVYVHLRCFCFWFVDVIPHRFVGCVDVTTYLVCTHPTIPMLFVVSCISPIVNCMLYPSRLYWMFCTFNCFLPELCFTPSTIFACYTHPLRLFCMRLQTFPLYPWP